MIDILDTMRSWADRIDKQRHLHVLLLGPSGVGKTSLLTAFYRQFVTRQLGSEIVILPEPDDAVMLQEFLFRQHSLFLTSDTRVAWEYGLSPTNLAQVYSFDVFNRIGSFSYMRLHIVDHPGWWIDEMNPDTLLLAARHQALLQYLAQSEVVILPLDTPALMEEDSARHDTINKPEAVTGLLKSVWLGTRNPRLVLLVPVRCESYMAAQAARRRLQVRLRNRYAHLLTMCDANDPPLAVAAAPVQTLGQVVYAGGARSDSGPLFEKSLPDAYYDPRDADQPLRHIVRFLLQQRQKGSALDSFAHEIVGLDSNILRSLETFVSECREQEDFGSL